MKLKTNFVIAAVFLLLLAFVYFYEIKGGRERQAAADRAKELLDFAPSEIRRLVLDRGDTVIVAEKQQDAWQLLAPVVDLADGEAIDRLLRNIDETERENTIVDSATITGGSFSLSKYGLETRRLRVLLETEANELDSLYFGDDSPTERYAYAQVAGTNREIFTVRAWRFDNLDKGVFDLRDRRVLSFTPDEVKELRLGRGQHEVHLVRADEDVWQLKLATTVAADGEQVEELLRSLESARIDSFADESPDAAVLAAHGLAPAQLEVSLLLGEDRAEKRLHIGSDAEGDYYARDQSRQAVVVIDSAVVHRLQLEPSEFRQKKPVAFENDSITRVELERDDEGFIALRDTAGTWSIAEPEVREARSWRLSGLLNDLEALEVDAFVADDVSDLSVYRLVDPQLRIRLYAGSEMVLDIRLSPADDGNAFLTLEGQASVYLVSDQALSDLSLTLEDVGQPDSGTNAQTAGPATEAVGGGIDAQTVD